MSIDKDKLRALAEAAGPKDYFAPQPYEEDRGYSDAEIRRLEFMAEADPATILELLDESDRLEGCDKAYAEAWEKARGLQAEMDDIVAERDRLKAENEALRNGVKGDYDLDAWLAFVGEAPQLRKDAERYQWLRDKSESVHPFYLSVPIWFTGIRFRKADVDSSIDAAMAKEKTR